MAWSTSDGEGRRFVTYFEWFVHSEVTGSVLLVTAALAAMVLANSAWSGIYSDLLHTYIGVSWGDATFELTLHHWVNDGLMVIFFFVVGLEIKRELVVGELSSLDKASLPVAAALGGMAVPALIYAVFNAGGPGAPGWGIPMATDIAFALGVLAIFGRRVPIGLKVFLTALAITDDLGAVAVIAIFYTEDTNLLALGLAVVLLAVLFAAIRLRIRRTGFLLILMIAVWLDIFASGIHATVAGILLAMVIPVRPQVNVRRFVEEAETFLDTVKRRQESHDCIITDREQLEAVEFLHTRSHETLPAGLMLERSLHPIQVWLILPLFALANAGVTVDSHILEALDNPVSLGILLGLALGKPLGIVSLAWLAVRTRLGTLPEGVSWSQIVGVGFLAGIGFTMSLFITDLAFADEATINGAKLGILVASLLSAAAGVAILGRSLPPRIAGGDPEEP
ncbi:MAG TPA: Na+/H+ antiporter NhaA [Candidatus Sulfomarinibacteraceae bacterium]|nr:Na+/H+ antiporter NhaA [Candidatus Sulfomarinibacteraceae bacterium]